MSPATAQCTNPTHPHFKLPAPVDSWVTMKSGLLHQANQVDDKLGGLTIFRSASLIPGLECMWVAGIGTAGVLGVQAKTQ